MRQGNLDTLDNNCSDRFRTTILSGQEFTGKIRGGSINQVYRFSLNGERVYFKPSQKSSSDAEVSMMRRVGIRPAEPARDGASGYDPHLANREIAFSRLGSMLGVDVTLEVKKAVLGEDVPTGMIFNSREFKLKPGTCGIITEEAKGRAWRKYDWEYYSPDVPHKEKPRMEDDITYGADDAAGRNLGDRLREQGVRLRKKSTTDEHFRGVPGMPDLHTPKYWGGMGKKTIDAANADYQRQMNQMFLLDTLAAHIDRHGCNYMVDQDAYGSVSVKAIDNDITFGALADEQADRIAFGKRGGSFNYGGLPARMLIDAGMAKKIRSVSKQMLDTTFSDLLEPREIDALWTRFQMMKQYIKAQEDEDPSRIVSVWNEETARREVSLAGGANSYRKEDPAAPGGFAGNSYYQRQMLMLHAAEMGDEWLWAASYGRY